VRLGRRLARVEDVLRVSVGCPECRGWTGTVLEGDDGPHRPERCPECGRLVPATVTVRIVGVRVALI
jgi:hypothetical protein